MITRRRQLHRTLAHVVEQQSGQHHAKPGETDGLLSKMTHVRVKRLTASQSKEYRAKDITHQSPIKTTFLLYFALRAGIRTACDEMGAVLIIGRWRPFG